MEGNLLDAISTDSLSESFSVVCAGDIAGRNCNMLLLSCAKAEPVEKKKRKQTQRKGKFSATELAGRVSLKISNAIQEANFSAQ